MDIRRIIGRRIHRLRRQQSLTQQELAKKIGVNASYIGPLEKGMKSPSLAVLQKLSEELGQPVFSFFLDEPSEPCHSGEEQRLFAVLASHPPTERRFILKMMEEMSMLLRAREGSSGS